jgi:hypothetical protein
MASIKRLPLILILLFAIHCSKEHDPKPQNTQSCFLTEIVMKRIKFASPGDNRNIKYTFTLNSDNKPVSEVVEDIVNTAENYLAKYSYDNLGRMITIERDYRNATDTRTDIIYNDDLVTEIKYQNATSGKYTYNASKQLIEMQQYVVVCIETNCHSGPSITKAYEYENINSKNPKTARVGTGGWTEISYDDKKGIWNQLSYEDIYPYFNNPTKLVNKDSAGKITGTTNITYDYNQKGYPTKMTITDDEATVECTLTYNCQ